MAEQRTREPHRAVAPTRVREPQGTRWALRLLAVGYVIILVVVPLGVMVLRTFEDGLAEFVESITSPEAITAITLSVEVAIQAVLINTIFGITVSLLITRYRFRGRNVLNALIDVPVSVSPVIAGLALILVYGNNGWFGGFLQNIGVQVIYSVPGIVLATCFVSLPLVVRELIPVLDEIGLEQEQAGRSLGASAWQRLWRLTLPSVRWALGVRGRAEPGPGARRVRRGPRRGRQCAGIHPDDAAARRPALQRPRRERRLRDQLRDGRHRHLLHHRGCPAATVGRTARTCHMGIQALNISKRFGDFVALDDISIDVRSGRLTALLGPSGGGSPPCSG